MHRSWLRALCVLCAIILPTHPASAQTSIRGIVNLYTPVISFVDCNGVTVRSTAGFRAGDTVLIIQMKGARMDTTESSTFGTIVDYDDAGNFEFAIVASVAGSTVYLRDRLLHHYTPSGLVQLIRVPHYDNANVSATVTAPAWDGSSGGVVALDVAGTLTMDADIDVSGLGFHGGRTGVSNERNIQLYSSPLSGGLGGEKGEGVILDDPARNACRGPRGNGGGGGNAHNAGGGGGGNGGAGAVGGNQYSGYTPLLLGGLGGRALIAPPPGDRIFFGGGGGGGHQNDNVGTAGAAGGGIVIIRAAQLEGRSHAVTAAGRDAARAGNDGAGGGGAGGTVLLDIGTSISAVTVDLHGGAGGNNSNNDLPGCHGTGGGAGGGTLQLSYPSLPTSVVLLLRGGLPGTVTNNASPCYGTSFGAGIGENGNAIYNMRVPQGTQPFPAEALDAGPDTSICAGDSVRLHASGAGPIRWTPAGGLSCTDCVEPWARPAATTTYHLTSAVDNACYIPDSVTITVHPLPTFDLGPDTVICAGDSATLAIHGESGVKREWSGSDGFICPDCRQAVVHPTGTTLYTVHVENQQGCASVDSIRVTVIEHGKVDIGPNRTICRGGSTTLDAGILMNPHWEPAEGLSCTDCAKPVASPDRAVTYTVTGMTTAPCPAGGTITVTVADPPALGVSAEQTTICTGGTTTIEAKGTGAVLWSPADGVACPTCARTAVTPGVTTTYRATLTSDAGCSTVDSVTVAVIPPPELTVHGDTTICAKDSVRLRSSSTGTVRWSPADGLNCVECAEPVAHPSSSTVYTATAVNAIGCAVADSVRVIVDDPATVAFSVARDHHVLPGHTIRVPVIMSGDVNDMNRIDTIRVTLGYDRRIILFDRITLLGSLTEGWTSHISTGAGSVNAELIAPHGSHLSGVGPLLYVDLKAFLGEIDFSGLPLSVALPGAYCTHVASDSGLLRLDSICGLSYRLIAVGTARYALGAITPNPLASSTEIGFSLGLDGQTTVEIFDVSGALVARLLDEHLPAGDYMVTWSAGSAPSGLYYCRIRSGDWSATGTLRLRK
jgi:hypothetical protein